MRRVDGRVPAGVGCGVAVGATYHFIAVLGEGVETAGLDVELLTGVGVTWSVFRASREDTSPTELDQLATSLAAAADSPALLGYVQHSDFAYIVATLPEGPTSRLVVSPEGADDYKEGAEALRLAAAQPGDPVARFEMWATLTGKPVGAERVREVVTTDWVVSEEALMAIAESLEIDVPWERL